MSRSIVCLCVAVILTADVGGVWADEPKISQADAELLKNAYALDLYAHALSSLIPGNTQNKDVEAAGEAAVRQHTENQRELEKIAQARGVKLSSAVTPEQDATYSKLARKKDPERAALYLASMVKTEEAAIPLLEKASADAQDAEIKAHASKVLPLAREQLKTIQVLASKHPSTDRSSTDRTH